MAARRRGCLSSWLLARVRLPVQTTLDWGLRGREELAPLELHLRHLRGSISHDRYLISFLVFPALRFRVWRLRFLFSIRIRMVDA
ncbi:hypothetical protein NL676_018582 [Syzygium grande]|nr:hypothetical protein NL676_018582 [Syzygium grande]